MNSRMLILLKQSLKCILFLLVWCERPGFDSQGCLLESN